MSSKAGLLTAGCALSRKATCRVYCKVPCKHLGQLMRKKLKVNGFQQNIFKGKERKGVCDQLMISYDWFMGVKINGQ